MKKNLYLIAFICATVLWSACTFKSKETTHANDTFRLQPQIVQTIDSFIRMHPFKFVELHINRVMPSHCFSILYGGEVPLSKVPAATYVSSTNGTRIGVYSGIEDLCMQRDTFPITYSPGKHKATIWLIKDVTRWKRKYTKECIHCIETYEMPDSVCSPYKTIPGYLDKNELSNEYIYYNIHSFNLVIDNDDNAPSTVVH